MWFHFIVPLACALQQDSVCACYTCDVRTNIQRTCVVVLPIQYEPSHGQTLRRQRTMQQIKRSNPIQTTDMERSSDRDRDRNRERERESDEERDSPRRFRFENCLLLTIPTVQGKLKDCIVKKKK